MLLTKVILLGSAAFVAAHNPFALRAEGDPVFPISTIPSVCDTPCAYYKSVFGTCPGNPSADVCGSVCNGTKLTELQVCINCTLISGPPNNMSQFNIDVLNGAQQQLAQACVEGGYPAKFTGQVPTPNTMPYPSGVNEATFAGNSTAAPSASKTGAASSSASSSAAANNSAAPSGKLDSGAFSMTISGSLVAVMAAGAALLL